MKQIDKEPRSSRRVKERDGTPAGELTLLVKETQRWLEFADQVRVTTFEELKTSPWTTSMRRSS